MLLEQNVNSTLGMRYNRWWAAYGGGGSVYLPLVMADSGHQYGNGVVDYYTVYKGYLDAELTRPAGATLTARASRVGSRFRVSVDFVNRSGVSLSAGNSATIHVIVYEDIKVGVTSRTVRDAVYTSVTTAITDGASRSFTLETNDVSPVNWANVHVLALADYRPGGTAGAYDMLQADLAEIVGNPVGDLDGDGTSDLVWRHATGGELWVWRMSGGAPANQTYVGTVADTGWQVEGLGDQTGDGRADLLWRHQTSGGLFLWTMNGTTITAQQYLGAVAPDYAIVGTADYTGDGKTDILWRHQASGELWLWQMNGAALVAPMLVATIAPAYAVAASGDVDGDGKADILWRHATNGDVWLWLMNGPVPTSQVYLGTVTDLGYEVAGLADHDRNGRADVLWRHATSGDVWLWQMQGTTIAAMRHLATIGDTNFHVAGVGDYDGDGRADVLWHHATSGAVWVWGMNGGIITSATQVATVPDVGYQIVNTK